MAAISQAAIAASVVVGLLAVPVASQEAEVTGMATGTLPNVSTAETVPKKVSRTTSATGFRATVQTAFDRFSTSISAGSSNATLERPGSELDVRTTSGSKEWVLKTPDGTLRIEKSSDRTVEEVSTPQGDLRIEVNDGARTTTFSGSNRQEVEEARRRLHDLLERRRQQLKQRGQRLRDRAMPDVEIVANSSTASSSSSSPTPEHVILVNREFEPVKIDGWKLSDPSSSHRLGDVTLEPGERLHVYTEPESSVGGSEPAVYDTGISWNDDGDVVFLENGNGEQITRESY
ncbi:MAG: lamin tail domain-containing protein [Candidatus Nanohaloarchaea archaeon]